MYLFEIFKSPMMIILMLAYIYLFGSLIYIYIKSFIILNLKNAPLNVDFNLKNKTSYKPIEIIVVLFLLSIFPFAMLALGSGGDTFVAEIILGILVFGPLFFSIAYAIIFYFRKILKKENTFLECCFFSFLLTFVIGFFIFLFNYFLSLQFIPYFFHVGNLIVPYFKSVFKFSFLIFTIVSLINLLLIPVLIVFIFSLLFFAIIDLREKEKRIKSIIKIILWIIFIIVIEILIKNSGFK